MHARRMPFSGNWVVSNWFEDEHEATVLRRRRILQAALGIALLIVALAVFGFVVAIAVDATAPKTFGQPVIQEQSMPRR